MPILDHINKMKANVEAANALIAQITPLHQEFETEAASLKDLDRSKSYFGINEDGTATVISFDPLNGAPKFTVAQVLPEPTEAAPEAAPEAVEGDSSANVVPLAIDATPAE